jgi:flavodoxin
MKIKFSFNLILSVVMMLCVTGCSSAEPKAQGKSNDTLIIYYSFTGNSKTIAQYAKKKLSADILELEPKIPFSTDYDAVVKEWQNNDIKRDVEIKPVTLDLTKYNKIVLITCVWWYGISPVMKKFLKDYDLSNKDVIVAASNAGWIGHSFKDYQTLLPNSNIKGQLNLLFGSGENERSKLKTTYKEIDDWLNKLTN